MCMLYLHVIDGCWAVEVMVLEVRTVTEGTLEGVATDRSRPCMSVSVHGCHEVSSKYIPKHSMYGRICYKMW